METESDEGLWAVVYAAGGRYLGCVCTTSKPEGGVDAWQKSYLQEDINKKNFIKLMPSYDLTVQVIPIPLGGGKMGFQREVSAGPVGLTLEEAPLYVLPTAIQFFADMKPADRNRYKALVDSARELCLKARVAQAGIQTVDNVSGMPPGGLKGNG